MGETTAMCGTAHSASLATTVATVKDATTIVVITFVVQAVVIAVLGQLALAVMEITDMEIMGMEIMGMEIMVMEIMEDMEIMGMEFMEHIEIVESHELTEAGLTYNLDYSTIIHCLLLQFFLQIKHVGYFCFTMTESKISFSLDIQIC